MKKITRRKFLHRGFEACSGLCWGASTLLCGCGTTDPIAAPELPSPSPTDRKASVAAIRGRDLAAMTRESLEALGGIKSVVHPGETVFIKPNFCSAGMASGNVIASGDSTKPEIVVTVAEECLKAGAAQVFIGEGAQVPRFSWSQLLTLDETTNLAAEIERLNTVYGNKVLTVCLNSESPSWSEIDSPYSGLGSIYVSNLATITDRVISLPVLKTHRWTGITCSLKNFVGITPVGHYDPGGYRMRAGLHNSPGGLSQCFLDINRAIEPDLTVVDISVCCESNGPHVMPGYWGTTVDMRDRLGDWVVLAGTDLVAVDATAARIISHNPAEIEHLTRAYNQGMGQIEEDKIDLIGDSLSNLRVEWQPADHTEGFEEVILPGIMLTLFG